MTGDTEAAAVEMDELTLMDWRRHTFAIYKEVREASSPEAAHALWRAQRDELFRDHPSSPLAGDDPLRKSGLPYWPYDPRWRYELEVVPTDLRDQAVCQHGSGGDHAHATAWLGRASGAG